VDRRAAGSRDLAPGGVAIPSEARRLRVAILSRRLVAGGSERQALLLAEGLAERGHPCTLITFRAAPDDPKPVAVRVIDLGGHRWWGIARFLFRLREAVRESGGDLVYGFLPVANLLALLLGALRPSLKVVLGIRASDLDLRRYGLRSRIASWAEARLAHRADAIIVNSEAGYRHAISRGIPGALMTVVRNGVDLDRFRRGPASLRSELGIEPDAIVIGLVARPDPMKDLDTFARAFALLHRRLPVAVALVAGPLPDADKARLEALAQSAPIRWAGWRRDMAAVYSSLDVFCLPSVFGEGTSNSIAEAMACGVPCVVTAVGDNAILVGDIGLTVPPASPEPLADALAQIAMLGPGARADLGLKARARIAELCGRAAMLDQTIEVLRQLLSTR
jgi:glycosyltransferase involved in cell wall biosynthesis